MAELSRKNEKFLEGLVDGGLWVNVVKTREHVRTRAEDIYGEPPAYLQWVEITVYDNHDREVCWAKSSDSNAAVKALRKRWKEIERDG